MEQRNAFDFGDTVCLRIGGPAMTVVAAREDACCCIWFEGPQLQHGSLEPDALELVQRRVRLIPTEIFSRSEAARA